MFLENKIAHLFDEKAGKEVVIAPTVPYGATDDLMGFAGTVSLGVEGLRNLLQTICGQLYDYGFRHFIVLNGHGGNCKSVDSVGIWLHEKGAYLACVNWWLIAGELHPEWKGGHGGGEETAGVMAVDPSLIKTEYLEEPEGIRNDVSEELPSGGWTSVRFKGASVTIPRRITDITENGWLVHGMGIDPPTKATKAWGDEMLAAIAEYMAEFAEVFARAELPQKIR